MLVLLTCVLATAVTVMGECDVGKVEYNEFKMCEFVGKWYWLCHTHNVLEKDYGCIIDEFKNISGVIKTTTFAYSISKGKNQILTGDVPVWTTDSYYHAFDDKDMSIWEANYYVLAMKRDQYIILKACLEGSDEPFMWIGYKSNNPPQSHKDAAKKKLASLGLSYNDFEEFKYCKV